MIKIIMFVIVVIMIIKIMFKNFDHDKDDNFNPSRPPYYNNKPKREGKDPANMSNYETNPVGALQVA